MFHPYNLQGLETGCLKFIARASAQDRQCARPDKNSLRLALFCLIRPFPSFEQQLMTLVVGSSEEADKLCILDYMPISRKISYPWLIMASLES